MKTKPTSKNEASIFADSELQAHSATRKFRITAADLRVVPRMTSDQAGTGQSLLEFMQRSPLADEPNIDLIRDTHGTRQVAL